MVRRDTLARVSVRKGACKLPPQARQTTGLFGNQGYLRTQGSGSSPAARGHHPGALREELSLPAAFVAGAVY
jgi:hypothetical protein